MKYLPNALTITRILVTPFLLTLLFFDSLVGYGWALALFVYASISDWADGKVARHYGTGSALGQFLDPIADKVLVLGTFIALVFILPEYVTWWLVALIALRDVSVTGLRLWLKRGGKTLKTSRWAKLKTTFQLTFLIAVLLLLTGSKTVEPVRGWAIMTLESPFIFWGLVAVTAVTLWTGLQYFTHQELSEAPDPDDSTKD